MGETKKKICCVPGCQAENKVLIKFPLFSASLTHRWIKAIARINWKPNESSYVCKQHFAKESYLYEQTGGKLGSRSPVSFQIIV